jgi:hypothetical protein
VTGPAPEVRPAEPRRRPPALPTMLLALACFAVAFEFLAFQLRAGRDPALSGAPAAAAPARVVPHRRIVITRVVGSRAETPVSQPGSVSGTASAPPAPVVTSSS